jgi:hypothetical protein
MSKRQEDRIVEDIRHYFGFLFDKGYTIREVRYFRESFGNWYILLEASKYFLRIDCDRSYISVLLDPEKENGRQQIGLETLIYYLSKGKHFVGYLEGNPAWGKNKQLERLAGLLREYHDQIIRLFEIDSQSLRDELSQAQKEYSELLQESYSRKFVTEKRTWKGLGLLTLILKLIGIGLLAYLAWGVGVVFVTATDINTKVIYGFIAFAIIVVLAMFTNRLLKGFQK